MKMEINESKLNMWRATLYLIGVDGKVTPEEQAWLKKYLYNIPFNDEQKQIIYDDIENGINDFQAIFEKITHAPDRATLVHFANMIFKTDGEFHPSEEAFLDTLHKAVMSKIDMHAALEKLNALDEKPEGDKSSAFDFLKNVSFFDDKE